MALLWAESFDLYGTSNTTIGQRGYAYAGGNNFMASNSANARTGTGYMASDSGGNTGLGLVVTPAGNVVGFGLGIYNVNANGNSTNTFGPKVKCSGNWRDIQISPNSSLGYTVWMSNVRVADSAPNLWTLGTWNWLEVKLTLNTGGVGTGSIEVRLEGVTILIVNNVNIPSVTGLGLGHPFGGWSNPDNSVRFDDWIIWDNSGTYNNDWMGDRRLVTSYPDADTADADWTPSTGVDGYAVIDETPPNDADYITANNIGDISEFEKQPIGLDTTDVAAICVVGRAFKSDAGISTLRLGIHSGAFVDNSEEISPGTSASYGSHIVERDPNGDIQWTRSSADAATVRVTRES